MRTVLIVEDDAEIAGLLGDYLAHFDLEPDFARRGDLALQLVEQNSYDAIVLDLNLPGIDGMEVCKKLREQVGYAAPILMLTARDAIPDRIEGLGVGADDYVVKPFDCGEVLARLQALARRADHWQGAGLLRVGDLEMDVNSRQVRRAGANVQLSPTEYEILKVLIKASPKLVRRDALVELVWGEGEEVDGATMRTHMYNLRQAIDADFSHPMLQTLRGIGYQLRSADDQQ